MEPKRPNYRTRIARAIAAPVIFAFVFGPFAPLVPLVSADIGEGSTFGATQTYASPGSYSWTVPHGITSVRVKAWGAGGAGGSGEKIENTNRSGLGGGAGGYAEKTIDVAEGDTYSIAVGAGGMGIMSYADGRLGMPGGNTTFSGGSVSITANGGTGGASYTGGGNPSEPIGMGGSASGGDLLQSGGNGGGYSVDEFGNPYASNGGSAYMGGNGGSRGRCGRDGSCPGSEPGSPLATDGGFPGGGGGGSDVSSGGYGGNGQVVIEVVGVAAADARPVGYLDNVSCSVINGWTYDPDDTSAQLNVHFYADGEVGVGTFIGNTVANIHREDVNNNMGVDGDHGYAFTVPDSLKDGGSHSIYAYGINSDETTNFNNALLTQSPQTITGCTGGEPVVVPTTRGNNIAFITAPTSVTAGQSFNVTVKNSGTRTWGAEHDLVISKGDLSENVVMVSLATTVMDGEKTVTFTAPATAGSYVIRGVEQNIEWFGSWNLTVTAVTPPTTPPTNPPTNPPVNPPTDTTPLSVTVVATPSSRVGAGTVSLSWSAPGAASCSTSWSGAGKPNFGTETSPSVAVTTTFTVTCTGVDGATGTGSATVTVTPASNTGGNNNGGGGTNNPPATPTRDFTLSAPSGSLTTEAGGTVTFTVVLTSAPTANVVLPVSTSNFNEGTTSPITSLTFTPANWNVPQQITVTGVDDTADDGDIAYQVRVGASQSADANWNNLGLKTIALINTDNDVPPASGGGGGGGGGGTQTVVTTVSSGGGGGGSGSRRHCTGFGCPTTVATASTDDIIILLNDYYSSNGSAGVARPTGPEQVCPAANFITTFLKKGLDNNPNEVRKLQYFLNTYENAGLTVSGEFDDATEEAVKALQVKYSDDILAPWGVTEPTGIVYITTTKYINTVYCNDNPGYTGNEDIKDILDSNVLEGTPINPDDFDDAIGQATSSPNIAAVFGSFDDRMRDALKDTHPYGLLILAILLIGTGFTLYGAFKKDPITDIKDTNIMRGLALVSIGSVLNVLNTLSFILNPEWFARKTNLTLSWLLGLDLINLLIIIAVCLSLLLNYTNKPVKVVTK